MNIFDFLEAHPRCERFAVLTYVACIPILDFYYYRTLACGLQIPFAWVGIHLPFALAVGFALVLTVCALYGLFFIDFRHLLHRGGDEA